MEPIAETGATSRIVIKPRRAWIAGVLSLIVPGLGQLYAGRLNRALAVYLGSIGLPVVLMAGGVPKVFAGLIALVAACFVYFLWSIWDAVRIARASGDYSLRRFNRWYVYLAVWLLAGFLIGPSLLALSPVRTFWIPSGSMEPTLQVGDHLCADMRHFRSAMPARGDLVIFTSVENPATVQIERVIGLEGETLEIRDKVVYINGRPVADPWGRHRDSAPALLIDTAALRLRDNFGPETVPPGMVFVMGDNRDNSNDSRFYGPVPMESLQGRPLYLYWAGDKSRIGQVLR